MSRSTTAALVALAVLAAGCSGNDSPSASSSGQASLPASSATSQSSSAAPAGPLDRSTCLDISFAKDNLMVATKADNARKAADTLEKYGPPEPVKAAIEHFVATLGAQPTDPGLDANRDRLTAWIKQICPNVNP